MLVKHYSIFQIFARRKEDYSEHLKSTNKATEKEKTERSEYQITHKEWINVDRIVMLTLILGVIIAAIIFS
ncbi:hypothetical protein ABDJ41_02850 [Pedobacter sp. ASV1-7]|uniref:hypothetical protein n=1 Tax=Pedobacter sp. ASV1-7 TaxID=3145237 RepID=UPI0032E92148